MSIAADAEWFVFCNKTYDILLGKINFQIEASDFHTFDFIFGMDENSISDLENDKPKESKSKILLLGDFDPEGERIIRDPYFVMFNRLQASDLLKFCLLIGCWF